MMRNGNRLAIGLTSGMLVGAAIGLLIAPKTGQETRHFITASARRLGQRVRGWRGGNGAEEYVNHHAGVSA
jgi:gas vesicle protein